MEIYSSGTVLQYDQGHIEDEFGGLSEAAPDAADSAPFEITQAEFELAWSSHKPMNQGST
jgi:hypothetical protein